MKFGRAMAVVCGSGAAAFALSLAPAHGDPGDGRLQRPRAAVSVRSNLGTFTPANGDPRLAAVLARSGLGTSGFRFTPATVSVRLNRSVTVAVRTRSAPVTSERLALVSPSSSAAGMSALSPIAYNLGVAVGWRRFAVSSEVAKVDLGTLGGGREAVDVGLSYNARKFSTRVAVGADSATPGTPRGLAAGTGGYTFDVGGSYRLSRNLDLTAGVRYRATERDRLAPLADNRRDSQAVYIGTAFRF